MTEIRLTDFSLSGEQELLLDSLFHGDADECIIHYISDFRSAKILREITDMLCKNFGMIPKWRTRIVLILDELHNNAIEYGSSTGDINTFLFRLERKTNNIFRLEASVIDSGFGPKAKKAFQMEQIRKEHENEDFSHHSSIRGRGLFLIISQLVDALIFDDVPDRGLKVTVVKDLILEEE